MRPRPAPQRRKRERGERKAQHRMQFGHARGECFDERASSRIIALRDRRHLARANIGTRIEQQSEDQWHGLFLPMRGFAECV